MKILICSNNKNLVETWKNNLNDVNIKVFSSIDGLLNFLDKEKEEFLIIIEDKWTKDISATIQEIFSNKKNIKIFLLSQEPDYTRGKAFLEIGIHGYGNAFMRSIHLNDAINYISEGMVWLYPEFIQNMIKIMTKNISNDKKIEKISLDTLTLREHEIVKLISKGMSNQEIATIIGVALRTVKAHTSAIYEKLGVKDRIALVLLLKN